MPEPAPEIDALEERLREVLRALRPYLGDLVLIGGWVPELHRRYGDVREWRSRMSLTREADVLVPGQIDPRERPDIVSLLTGAGFRPMDDEAAAAVWSDVVENERAIEFFIPHHGTARDLGHVRPIAEQPGLGAVSLTDLDLLAAHTATLLVPTALAGDGARLPVRVPTLGAFVVAKAATYLKRGASAAEPTHSRGKFAKDVLYIRDILAAGEQVVALLQGEWTQIRESGESGRQYVRYARTQLTFLVDREPTPVLGVAAEMLAERDDLSITAARADVQGHITDLLEMLDA